MPKRLVAEYQEFTFDDQWDAEKYDDHADTKKFVGTVEHRKAVDFVGYRAETVYLIEVKDYRGHRIQNKFKLNGDLQRHVAGKVFDTIAGLVLAHRTAPATPLWRNALSQCRTAKGVIRVVLWLEDDALFRGKGARGKNAASVFTAHLKKALRWLPGRVFVVNRSFNHGALPGVTVSNLPDAMGR